MGGQSEVMSPLMGGVQAERQHRKNSKEKQKHQGQGLASDTSLTNKLHRDFVQVFTSVFLSNMFMELIFFKIVLVSILVLLPL